ncbi:SurA N-terminal domain-containing protein [Virgibacillus sp. W0181]|uniref:SurA N-terminal domain-containing protein n=1 Tax=Virgibacillus sp. W0181 TaxID=3391581 RepID=UPI003F44946B
MKKWIVIVAAMILAVGLAACGDKSDDTKNDANDETKEESKASENEDNAGKEGQAGQEIEISEEEKMDADQVVLNINGNDVKGDQYNNIYPQVKAQANQTEEEVAQDELKKRTIDSLIERELIMQGAEKEGVVIEDEEVSTELETIKSANGEGLTTLMEQFHLTEDGFKDQLKFELTLEKYSKAISDTEVTDEEINEYYDRLKEQNEDLPELKELKDSIKAQIQQQQSMQEVQKVIEEMKEKADIERKV